MKYRLLDLFCGAGGCSMGYHLAGFEVIGVDKVFQKRYPFRFIKADALTFLDIVDVSAFDAIHASPPCQLHSPLAHLPSFDPSKHEDLIEPTRERLKCTGLPYIIENVPGAPLIEPFTLCGSMFGLRTDCGAELRRHRLFETNWFDDLLCMPQCRHYADRPTLGVTGTGQAMTGARNVTRNTIGVKGGHAEAEPASDRRVIAVYGDHPRDPGAAHRNRTVTVTGHSSNDWGQSRDRRKQKPSPGKRICEFCGYEFDEEAGWYGCPNCEGEGLQDRKHKIRETFPIEQAQKAMGIDWMTMAELSQSIPPAYTFWIGERLKEYLDETRRI